MVMVVGFSLWSCRPRLATVASKQSARPVGCSVLSANPGGCRNLDVDNVTAVGSIVLSDSFKFSEDSGIWQSEFLGACVC